MGPFDEDNPPEMGTLVIAPDGDEYEVVPLDTKPDALIGPEGDIACKECGSPWFTVQACLTDEFEVTTIKLAGITCGKCGMDLEQVPVRALRSV